MRRNHQGRHRLPMLLGIACGLAVMAALSLPARGQEGDWPAGWRFRVRVAAAEKAASYDLWLTHQGLARTDGRDLLVAGPEGKPVSHFVSFADDSRVRLLFDGNAGPGTYSVYFGNTDPSLPALPPSGLVPRGRPEWLPVGGYTCVTYKAPKHRSELQSQLLTGEQVLKVFDALRAGAEAGQAKLDQLPAPKESKDRPVPFVMRSIYPDSHASLPGDPGETLTGADGKPYRAEGRFVHVFGGVFDLPEADDCYFVVEQGDAGGELKVMIVDGDTAHPVVKGWFRQSYGYTVSSGTGSVNLRAGRHGFQLYTFASRPEIRVRFGSSNAPLEALDGRFAAFDGTARVTAGAPEVATGTLAAACLDVAQVWLARGQFAQVQVVCQRAPVLLAGQDEAIAKLATLSQAAREQVNARFWPMEGKVPERTGAVAGVAFGPPFRVETNSPARSFHDSAGLSGCVWPEAGLIYGLPFAVFPDAWVVTSGTCFDDGMLYVGLRNGRMLAVDYANAKLKWSFPGEGPCHGSPLLYRGVLYYGALDRRLYALDAKRGQMRWNFPTRGWIEGSPAAAGDTVFFGSADGCAYAVDAALGVERWQARLDGPVLGTPACQDGRVYLGTMAGTFHALSAADGQVVWTYKAAGAIAGGACVAGNRVAFGDAAGLVHCLDTATGKLVWPQPCKVGGPVGAAPIYVDGVFYGGNADGSAYWGIDAEEGVVGWSLPVIQEGDVHRPPLFANGRLVYASRVYADAKRSTQGAVVAFVADNLPPQACLKALAPITVDGNLNEESWQQCGRLPAFRKPNGMVVADRVVAKIMYDDQNLYLGIVCQDAGVTPGTAGHDADTPDGDAVRVLLDPRQNGLGVADLTVTAGGVKSDRLVTGLGRDPNEPRLREELAALKLAKTGKDWEPTWQAAVTTQATGWTAEIAIPLASLPAALFQAPGPGRIWNINVVVTDQGAPAGLRKNWYLAPTADPTGAAARWMPLVFDQKKVGETK